MTSLRLAVVGALSVVLLTVAAPPASAAYCWIPPQTVTIGGTTVSTPGVLVPCP